jgi:hypothetical protein
MTSEIEHELVLSLAYELRRYTVANRRYAPPLLTYPV